jgi:putative Mn2+ efflux pump MntP
MKEDGAIRFGYILIVAIHNNDKSLNLSDDKNQLTFQTLSLSHILDATAWFASLAFKHQVILSFKIGKYSFVLDNLHTRLAKIPASPGL